MGQTSYNFNPAVGIPGMVAESREANVIISKLAQGLVPVGLLVSPGTDPEIGMLPTIASPQSSNPGQVIAFPTGITDNPLLDTEWIGVSVYDSSGVPYTTLNQYQATQYVPVLRWGVVWVATEAPVTQYSNVYVRVSASGPNTVLGGFAGATGTGLVLFPHGRWMTASNNGVAVLEIH